MTLHLFYQNSQGIRTKLDQLNLFFSDGAFDIIILTETWLKSTIFDGEVLDGNFYSIFRRDRSDSPSTKLDGGGVLIAVKKSFAVRRCYEFETEAEIIWVEISLTRKKIYLCSIYYPENTPDSVINEFDKSLELVLQHAQPNDTVFAVGDFNLRDIEWIENDDGIIEPVNYSSRRSELFLNSFIHEHSLYQLSANKTCNDHYLDLAFSNTNDVHATITERAVFSIHEALHCELLITECKSGPLKSDRIVYNYSKADFNHARAMLSTIPWSMLDNCEGIDECVDMFYDFLFAIINDSVPKLNTGKRKFPPWYDADLICLVREKEAAHRRYKRREISHQTFSDARRVFKDANKMKFDNYMTNIEHDIQKNPKRLWGYIKSKTKSSSIPGRVKHNDIYSEKPIDRANVFNNFFKSVFIDDNEDTFPTIDDLSHDTISGVSISCDGVLKELLALDIHKAIGPDNISGIFLKNCANELCVPLTIIFNMSLKEGVFPSIFKRANVVPIFKSGDKCAVKNYRPVSLLSIVSKLFEKLVHAKMYEHVKHLISESQHGFVKSRSTQTNLVSYVDFLSDCLDKKLQVDAIYTDFSKAFDSVSHKLLFHKLKIYGFSGRLLKWFDNYLSMRVQRVVINGQSSDWTSVTSGVPQGSLLGPLMFVLYINDLPSVCLNSNCSLYADDAKIYKIISTLEDCKLLQHDINKLIAWCKIWKLSLNIIKCVAISFTNKRNKITWQYHIEDIPLERKTCVKDLGVLLSSDLNFNSHIKAIVNKGFRMLGFIKRSSKGFSEQKTLLSLYFTHVRCHLEYCSVVFNPWQKTWIEEIERVQRKFVKFLCFKFGHPYDGQRYKQICSSLGLPTLHSRRAYLDAMFLHKCAIFTYNCPYILSRLHFSTPTRVLRRCPVFRPRRSRINLHKHSPLIRSMTNFNDIVNGNNSVDLFSSTSSFKSKLRHILLFSLLVLVNT